MTNKDVRIKKLDLEDIPQWNQYVMESPKATFYHRIEWKHIIETSFGHKTYYLMAFQSFNSNPNNPTNSINSTNPTNSTNSINSSNPTNSVVGILPLVHIKSLIFGSIFCSMPFLNFGGVCADNVEVEKMLISEAERLLRDQKGDYIELRHLRPSSANLLGKTHKVSMTLELNRDPDALWNKFSSKHRQTIRKAAKNGLEVTFGGKELLNEFYTIMCLGWRDLGTPIYPISFFENIMDSLGDSVEICLVSYQGKPIGTAFVGLFKKTVEGMWLSFMREFTKLQTNYFQYWEMIKRACEQGYEEFHLGRSSVESGGEVFKEKWNAVPKPLYWEYILNKMKDIPELNVQNPKYRFAIRTWKKLPLPVTRMLGPILAKNIP